jgi:hypothetical protein
MSIHMGQLHGVLRDYKRLPGRQGQLLQRDVVAMFWRFLMEHEKCLARRCRVATFPIVTTVPSGSRERDAAQPLRKLVSHLIGPTRSRYERLLVRSSAEVPPRTVDPTKYDAARQLSGEPVLLIDDTWTTGSNVQSAACALSRAGAGPIGVVVAGRHIHDDFADNGDRLRQLPSRFDWSTCVFH